MFFTMAGASCSICAGQGPIDVFFLSGGEIDGRGATQSGQHRDYRSPERAFPGSFAQAISISVVPEG